MCLPHSLYGENSQESIVPEQADVHTNFLKKYSRKPKKSEPETLILFLIADKLLA
jgi:hypothetical protein